LIRELADIENASENEEVKLKAILATLTILIYKYDESGGGLLREREVVGGTKTRFHWEGLNLYMEEEWSGSAWVPKRTYINQPSALGYAHAAPLALKSYSAKR